MTVRDAINISLEKKDVENAECLDFSYLLMSTANVLVVCGDILLSKDFPDYEDGDVEYSGKAVEKPGLLDYINVFAGYDLLRHTTLFAQLQKFINWWLDQEAEEDPDKMWYDINTVAALWNEFAQTLID